MAAKGSGAREPWLGRALVQGAFAGIVAPLMVVFLVAMMSGWLRDLFREPTCDDPKDLALITPSGVETRGNTVYSDADGAYPASTAIDTNSGTAWVEAAPGYGVGEWLRFSFDDRPDIQMVCVVNGYAQNAARYELNGRVRQLDVTTDAGNRTAVLADLPLDEVATFQRLRPLPGRTATVTLTIRSTSSMGGSQAVADTAISEVEFWGR